MLAVSLLLLTLWLGSLALDLGMSAWVHLLAVSAILIVLTRRAPRRMREV
jgi:hypothetical protein